MGCRERRAVISRGVQVSLGNGEDCGFAEVEFWWVLFKGLGFCRFSDRVRL